MAISNKICKGSGYFYVRAYDSSKPIPTFENIKEPSKEECEAWMAYLKELRTSENELGALKNGYTYQTEITMMKDSSDMGQQKVNDIQEETGKASGAIFAANGDTISRMYPMAKTGYNEEMKMRITAIGGKGNQDDTEWETLFVHPDTKEGDTVIYTRGQNFEGLQRSFQPSQVTPQQFSYESLPLDDSGRLAYEFDMPAGFQWADTSTRTGVNINGNTVTQTTNT